MGAASGLPAPLAAGGGGSRVRAPARRLLCVQGCERAREGAPDGSGAGWLRLVSFSFFVSAFAKFCRLLVWPGVFVLFVSLGSALLLSGAFRREGRGWGRGRASGSRKWREREGRESCKSIVWLQDRSWRQKKKKKKKNLSKDLPRSHSLPPSLVHSLALRAGVQPRSWSRRRKRRKRRRRGDCPGAKSRAAHSQPFRKAIEIRRTRRAEAPVTGAPREPGRPGRRPAARGVAGALPGSGGISMKVVRVGRCAASSWRWAAAAACPRRPARASLAPAAAARFRRIEAARRSLRAAWAAAAAGAAAAAETAGSGPEPPRLAPPPPLKPLLPPPEPLLLLLPPPPHTHRERVNSPAAGEK
ncbi:atherin-like [Sus scrofa]|uniref:atherin-like n=1 Tax=Sus scrofa TaxID=9823 RepID=UPI000A2B254D|nr:atherin-like [Sus scrofa]XP_020954996.1 atherin-like [Sus scrofa]XP_020954997.1 atherin-like [Sus scrofa]XP_020954998.1 atherin-like [Sus scrofa]XP_020954999.1 atherin-like [Sus scrofa]XP_020955000.1 atherin-like [Sus scrofa]XP_020955001.1 atherin-like [Sus scrofa]XP_020955002.1 atherin-like [Sus scrofa]XP_020955003.1 atherin-like [Sus scrofa]XP_020955004.1 atherin-like [Sus scrofa]XP_020955005.1 atherin-like [Sus scrofa]XP_020955006.1 atherin-like [Sus scrofa]XP_020955007.1 atherin-